MKFSANVSEALGHYVYVYVDPRDSSIFYVGKGVGKRCLTHLSDAGESEKVKRIKAIRDAHLEPRIDILVYALHDEETAFRVEAAAIDLIGREKLTNRVRGWGSITTGRIELGDFTALHDRRKANIKERALLIRINQLYRYDMTPVELYDATRGVWRIGPARVDVEYAFAVYQGVVREVYSVTQWFPAGSTFSTRGDEGEDGHGLYDSDRWEFVGVLADEKLRNKYVNSSVAHYFPRNMQGPFRYVNVKDE